MTVGKSRILYCEGNTDGTVGGSFYSLLFLIEGLDRARFEPVVVFYFDHALIPRFRKAGADVRVFHRPQPFRLATLPIVRSIRPLKTVAGLVQSALNFLQFVVFLSLSYAWFLKRERVDLLHLNNSIVRNAEWFLAAFISRTHCVTHERGINDRFSGVARFVAPRLDAIICISTAVRDNMVRRGIPPRNLHIVHNGLDPLEIRPSRSAAELRAAWGLERRSPVVGMVGNLKRWKGQHVLVQALPSMKAAFPELVCLLIGDTSPADKAYEAHLRALIAELGLEDTVRFLGYQRNVADALSLLDVAILASTQEPFGRVLLEAMALKKPIVASHSGAVAEIVVDGATGYIFPDGDSARLAAHTISLLEAPASARAMGEAGFRRLTDVFHIRQNVVRTEELYDEILPQ